MNKRKWRAHGRGTKERGIKEVPLEHHRSGDFLALLLAGQDLDNLERPLDRRPRSAGRDEVPGDDDAVLAVLVVLLEVGADGRVRRDPAAETDPGRLRGEGACEVGWGM